MKTILERDGDELRITTQWANGKRIILLSWWRLKQDGTWRRLRKADLMGFIGLTELEQVITALQKARDWIKETGS